MIKSDKKNEGFTLIETLIVIAVIGILASIVAVGVSGVREKARLVSLFNFEASVYHALGADLVGEWKLDEGTGSATAYDTSGNGNNLTTITGLWVDSALPELKSALSFSNSQTAQSNSVAASNPINLGGGPVTIALWVKPIDIPSSYALFCYSSSTCVGPASYKYGILRNADASPKISMKVGSFATNYSNNSLPQNQWSFVVATCSINSDNTKNLIYYINGTKDAEFLNLSFTWSKATLSNTIYIGNNSNSIIDDVRVYSSALNQAQIQKLYAEGAKKRGLLAEK